MQEALICWALIFNSKTFKVFQQTISALSLAIIKLYKISPICNLLFEVHTRDHFVTGVSEVFSAKAAAVTQETESALK